MGARADAAALSGALPLSQKGALDKISDKGGKLSNADDLDHRREDMVADIHFSKARSPTG